MLKMAADDEAKGNFQSAENNLRLALAFAPSDRVVKEALARVMDKREEARRKANAPPR